MSDPDAPAALLEAARHLCQRPDPGTAGLWPRAAALLGRQAIEAALDIYWQEGGVPAVIDCPMRTQLLCLAELAGRELAGSVAASWGSLTGACHIHPYDLAPTASELLGWMEAVEEFCRRPGSSPAQR